MPTVTGTAQRHWSTVTDHLISEFDSLAPGRVVAAVAFCRRRLTAMGVRGEGLAFATESMARTMLSPKV